MVGNSLHVQVVWEVCIQIHLTVELVRHILPTQYIGRIEEVYFKRA